VYSDLTKTCYLAEAIAVEYEAPVIALDLVHEATHARLAHARVSTWPDSRHHEEAVCCREQIAFAQVLQRAGATGVEAWLDHLRAKISAYTLDRENAPDGLDAI